MTATSQLQSVLDNLEKRIRDLESYRQGGEAGTEKAGGKGNNDGEPKGEYYPRLGLGYCTVMRYFFMLCSLGWKFDKEKACSIIEVRYTCIF